MSLPTSPFAKLVSGVSSAVSQASNAGTASAQAIASDVSKLKLDSKISAAAGEFGSGLNGATSAAKNLAGQLGSDAREFASNIGAVAGSAAGIAGSAAGAVSRGLEQAGAAAAGLQSLANNASASTADISGALSKLSGGSLATGLSNLSRSSRKSSRNIK
jgi:hypothetical protein